MPLALRHIAAGKISPYQIMNPRQEEVIKSIQFEIREKRKELIKTRDSYEDEYKQANSAYYNILLHRDTLADVYLCASEMALKHSEIIELRRHIAIDRVWTDNIVRIDICTTRYLAWPNMSMEREDLITMLHGIIEHHEPLELENPTYQEGVLRDMIESFVQRCKHWYDILNTNVQTDALLSYSREMSILSEKIYELEDEIDTYTELLTNTATITEGSELYQLWSQFFVDNLVVVSD